MVERKVHIRRLQRGGTDIGADIDIVPNFVAEEVQPAVIIHRDTGVETGGVLEKLISGQGGKPQRTGAGIGEFRVTDNLPDFILRQGSFGKTVPAIMAEIHIIMIKIVIECTQPF